MWLLESDLFDGASELYLFGRTAAEPGQLAISDKTISRKYITIQVDNVAEGGGRNLCSRSTVTIEDLDSKKGTLVNGEQIRGQKKTLSEDENEVKLGMCLKLVRFSFTAKELRADPWTRLRDTLEQLDIKYSADYPSETTHTFIHYIVEAATVLDDAVDGAPSALEDNFEASWPNALDHLPPRSEEPGDQLPEAYALDDRKQEVFDGYTFVFYEKKQYENLFPAITSGKGKALLKEVVARETDIDDFIPYVKGVAGEKGLGSFEDGSEGKGVVVFLASFAQRLDYRPIDQREFLEAILAGNASMLRRPLEEASQPVSAMPQGDDRMDIDRHQAPEEQEFAPAPRAGRGRRAGRRRFQGFDFDDAEEPATETLLVETPPYREPSFPPEEEVPETRPVGRTSRKRAHSPPPEHDTLALMAAIAPTAVVAKRRHIESGQPAVPPPLEPEPEPEPTPQPDEDAARGKGKKIKVEDDILGLTRRQREEAEALAAAKRKELEELPDDGIDYAAIRALHIVVEFEVRVPAAGTGHARSREQDIADGRWDPRWNGRKNFKRFRAQGEQAGRRAAPRIIISLEEVKPKEYGIGDDYWLEDVDSSSRSSCERRRRKPLNPNCRRHTERQQALRRNLRCAARCSPSTAATKKKRRKTKPARYNPTAAALYPRRNPPAAAPPKQPRRPTRSAARGPRHRHRRRRRRHRGRRRRRARQGFRAPASEEENDGSDDELKFRFGRRR
ncbi:hypothetical protein C8A01DRAFT_51226 [Parachaetomium inaequale]|uniref:FHA domain-containing protein n=1 Tax=Parachaetomium inaequale TaxID=2588326 RepID=A0AAN6SLK5_9PEZI|nr:hypothetical protein C8A01DRAFT_51226 [Parachaetomium inaequale]